MAVVAPVALGGSGSIADRIGDPVLGDMGIAALIGDSASNIGGFDVTNFNNATSVAAKLSAVTGVFDQALGIPSSNIIMPSGTYSSLSVILTNMGHD